MLVSHINHAEINKAPYSKIDLNGQEIKVPSKKILVGNIVKIYEHETTPADLILLCKLSHQKYLRMNYTSVSLRHPL